MLLSPCPLTACSAGLGGSAATGAGDGGVLAAVPEELALPRDYLHRRRHTEVYTVLYCMCECVSCLCVLRLYLLLRQMSSESKLFLQADRSWREMMRVVSSQPSALKAATTPGLLHTHTHFTSLTDTTHLLSRTSLYCYTGVLESFQMCSVLLEQVFKCLEVRE